jgi:dinuclear metal center YbgI/SA1388 family protein
MRVGDLLGVLEGVAPSRLAQPWDNVGLLVGDEKSPVQRVLAALELTDTVLAEAAAGGCEVVLTHHPLLFSPLRSLVDSHPKERLVRSLVVGGMSLIACHTNLDAASGGLAEIAAEALGLCDAVPLEPATAGWSKLIGFVPAEAVDRVAAAVFAAGAGGIGEYSECAFAVDGTGWFTPGPGSRPSVGQVARAERTPEVRWETVVPKGRLAAVVRAFVKAHPYEEPAFDIYPVEDVLSGVGVGRAGLLSEPTSVRSLAERAAKAYELPTAAWSGNAELLVQRVGVLPGSGRGCIDNAIGQCEALITGDMSYHDAQQAAERGLALIDVPHGDIEWWAFRRWAESLGRELGPSGIGVMVSKEWRSPWSWLGAADERGGGSRG